MSVLTPEVKAFLLKLARSAIEAKLLGKSLDVQPVEKFSEVLEAKRGCFVTLHKNDDLRGCIGTIEPVFSLLEGVKSNALNAAFSDPRFPALTQDELKEVEIEISVLTVPQEVEFKNGEDLKNKLKPGVHGVILSRGFCSSTFLPQVWEQLPDKETFLTHLCLKGGMEHHCWKNPETTVKVYEAEYFSE